MTQSIGRYQVQAELGRGGFGRVFRAYDPTVGRLVAIKTLNTSDEPEMLTRFRSEAAATGKLHHPNIVVIYDFGEHDGSPFLVMELLDGEDLERIVANRRNLTLLRTLDIMLQAAAGLEHAHSKGIVHRDIKPANIMLLADGSVKIMDFGIALVTQATAARITPQGSLIGTLPYMAPEQFTGSVSDVLCDIFAFGITFYRVLTGAHPFHANDMGGLMHNILKQVPAPVRSLRPDSPVSLEPVIGRLLAKDRDERYQSLEDMHFDLESIVLSLRKESVGQLFAEAQDLLVADEVEKAQSVVKQVMEIDPGNRTARELRERLQRQIKERSVRPRVNALLEAGRQQMSARHFDSAIQKFESALRLDDSNPELRTLIGHARSAFQRARRADELLEVARQAIARQDLTSAHLNLTDALSEDPQHNEAQSLLDAVRTQMDSRRRAQRLGDGLSQVKKLILLHSFEEAIKTGTELIEEYPESKEAEQFLVRARREWHAQLRQERLLAGTGAAKELLRNRNFSEAAQRIAQLLSEFPDSPELHNLSAYADEELQAEKQARLIARATEDTQQLLAAGDFDTALDRLKGVLIEYPGLTPLQDLLQTIAAQKAEYQRKIAMIEAVRQGEALTSQGRFVEAIDQIGAFVTAYGDSSALDAIRKEAERGLESHRRTTAIRKLVLEAQELLGAGKAGEATEILQHGTMEFPGDPRLIDLLGIAEASHEKRPEATADKVSGRSPGNESVQHTDSVRIPEASRITGVTQEPAGAQPNGRQSHRRVLVVTSCAGAAALITSVAVLPHWSNRKPRSEIPASVARRPEPQTNRTPTAEPPTTRTPKPESPTVSMPAPLPRTSIMEPPTARTPTSEPLPHTPATEPPASRTPTPKPPSRTPTMEPPPSHSPTAASNAEAIEQQDWERLRGSSDVSRLRDYLRSHPNGPHGSEAESRIADLMWNAVDQGNIEAVGRFVRENAGSPHRSDAQKILDQYNAQQQQLAQERSPLEQAAQDRTRQDKHSQPPGSPPPSPAPNTPSSNHLTPPAQSDIRKQQVIDTLAQLDAAFQRRRTRDVKAIWPRASQPFLESLGSSQVKISLTSKAETVQFPAGSDRAQAQCDLTTVIQGVTRHQKATLTLTTSHNSWIVESLIVD